MAYLSHSVDNLGPPFLLVDEAVFVIPKGGVMQLNKHHFKFVFILNGEIEHEIDGLDARRPLSTGDILIAPVVGYHRYVNPNPTKAIPLQVIRFFLDAECLQTRSQRKVRRPEHDLVDFIAHHFHKVEQLRGGIDNEITELIKNFRKETEQKLAGYRHRCRAICTELIVVTSRKLNGCREAKARQEDSRQGAIVSAAREYILKHLAKEMTLGEIAWHVGKGEEHLARVFKRETGQSVFDYVREMRINQAKTHLLDPSLSLTRIAEQCGFNTLSFFSRTFRQLVGMSPSFYRRHAATGMLPMDIRRRQA